MHEVRALGPLAAVVLSLSAGLWHGSWSAPPASSTDELRVDSAPCAGTWLEQDAGDAAESGPQAAKRIGQRTWIAMTRSRSALVGQASCSRQGAQGARRNVHVRDLRAGILRSRAKLCSESDSSIT